MKNEKRKRIIELLKDFHLRESKIAALNFELERFEKISGKEMLGAMVYPHGREPGNCPEGHITDKTPDVAMSYQERADWANKEAYDDIAKRLLEVEVEQDRLKLYLSFLSKRQQEVIRKVFIEGIPQKAVAAQINTSSRTVERLMASALDRLADMYEFTGQFKK